MTGGWMGVSETLPGGLVGFVGRPRFRGLSPTLRAGWVSMYLFCAGSHADQGYMNTNPRSLVHSSTRRATTYRHLRQHRTAAGRPGRTLVTGYA